METGIYLMTTQGPRQEAGLWCYTLEAILHGKEHPRTGYGKLFDTSENELVLAALDRALARLKGPAEVTICTGSRHLVSALANGWVDAWQQAGWRNQKGKPVAHAGLWQEIVEKMDGCSGKAFLDSRHKYSPWQKFQLGKLENVDFTRWEEGLSPQNPSFD